MSQLTKSEIYHIIIGLIACIVWMFGKKAGLEPDVIQFAGITTTTVVGLAVKASVSPNEQTAADPSKPLA